MPYALGWWTLLLLLGSVVEQVHVLSASVPQPPVVHAPAGDIQGSYLDSLLTVHYTDIPYAAAPIGARRFLPPVPLQTLPSSPSPFPANSSSSMQCMQYYQGQYFGTESCLTLSIDVPHLAGSSGANLMPVVVWFCGGAFQFCQTVDASTWVNNSQSFIFVYVNYRLNVMGFFSHPALSVPYGYSGNQGLQDQVAALQWVQRNIRSFGGDPAAVTVQGESAGSMSICYLLIMPSAAGLFRSVVMESGGCEFGNTIGSFLLSEQEAVIARSVVQPSSCNSTAGAALVACLQSMSLDELYKLYAATPALTRGTSPFPGTLSLTSYIPVIDGVIIPQQPVKLFQTGRHLNVSAIIGTNSGEYALWLFGNGPNFPYNYTFQQVQQFVAGQTSNNASITDFYSKSNYLTRYGTADVNRAFVDATSSPGFHCPARRVARSLASSGSAVFHYTWNYTLAADWYNLVAHFGEVPIIFSTDMQTIYRVMTAQFRNYLHRFYVHGSPNTPDAFIDSIYAAVYLNQTLPVWPRFQPGTGDRSLLVSSTEFQHLSTATEVHKDQCDDLWDWNLLTQLGNDSCPCAQFCQRAHSAPPSTGSTTSPPGTVSCSSSDFGGAFGGAILGTALMHIITGVAIYAFKRMGAQNVNLSNRQIPAEKNAITNAQQTPTAP